MRVALFGAPRVDLDPAEHTAVDCDGERSEDLPAALERAEAALGQANADAALIAGGDDWALAAALACSKQPVPFAFVGGEGIHAGHLERLSAVAVDAEQPLAEQIQRWLAGLAVPA